jgi:hypothetical protein
MLDEEPCSSMARKLLDDAEQFERIEQKLHNGMDESKFDYTELRVRELMELDHGRLRSRPMHDPERQAIWIKIARLMRSKPMQKQMGSDRACMEWLLSEAACTHNIIVNAESQEEAVQLGVKRLLNDGGKHGDFLAHVIRRIAAQRPYIMYLSRDSVQSSLRSWLLRGSCRYDLVIEVVLRHMYCELQCWCMPFTQEARDALNPRRVAALVVREGAGPSAQQHLGKEHKMAMVLEPLTVSENSTCLSVAPTLSKLTLACLPAALPSSKLTLACLPAALPLSKLTLACLQTLIYCLIFDGSEVAKDLADDIIEACKDWKHKFALAGDSVKEANRVLYSGLMEVDNFMAKTREIMDDHCSPCITQEALEMFHFFWENAHSDARHMGDAKELWDMDPDARMVEVLPLRERQPDAQRAYMALFEEDCCTGQENWHGYHKDNALKSAREIIAAVPVSDTWTSPTSPGARRLLKEGVCTPGSREWRLAMHALSMLPADGRCMKIIRTGTDLGNHLALTCMVICMLSAGEDEKNDVKLPITFAAFRHRIKDLRISFQASVDSYIRINACIESTKDSRFRESDSLLQLALDSADDEAKMARLLRFCPTFPTVMRDMGSSQEYRRAISRLMANVWCWPTSFMTTGLYTRLEETGVYPMFSREIGDKKCKAPSCPSASSLHTNARSSTAKRLADKFREKNTAATSSSSSSSGSHTNSSCSPAASSAGKTASPVGKASSPRSSSSSGCREAADGNEGDLNNGNDSNVLASLGQSSFKMPILTGPDPFVQNVNFEAAEARDIACSVYMIFAEHYAPMIPCVVRAIEQWRDLS